MLNQLELEEKKASKVKLFTRVYSNFVLKYPIVPLIFSIVISLGLFIITCLTCGFWPTCNRNYYHWTRDEISEKWFSYLSSTKNTYGSLHKLLTNTFSIPYQFDHTQVGCLIYERRQNNKNINTNNNNTISDDRNVLNVDSLREIWDLEEAMHKTEGWSDYCYKIPKNILPSFLLPFLDNLLEYMRDHLSELEEDTNCLSFKSIITEFKKYMRTSLNITNPKSSDLTEDVLYGYLKGYDDLNRSIEKRLKVTYFGTDYKNMKTTRIRSLVLSGLPLKGYESKNDRFDEQTKKLGKWQTKFLKPLYNKISDKDSLVIPYAAFPFEMEYEIFTIVLQHLPYFFGTFVVLVVISWIVFQSFFIGVLGNIGIFLDICLAIGIVNLIFQMKYIDVIFAMNVYIIFIIGGLCNAFIYQIYKNNKSFIFLVEKTTKVMLVALFFNSFCFLAALLYGFRIGQYFSIYLFMLNLLHFFNVFTWFLPIISLYSKVKTKKFKTESMYSFSTILLATVDEDDVGSITNSEIKKSSSTTSMKKELSNTNLYTNSKSTSDLNKLNDSELNSESNNFDMNIPVTTTNSSSVTSTNVFSYAETVNDYPHQNIFDFLNHKVTFKLNCCSQYPTNIIEKFFCYYFWPLIYFYRFIILLLTAIFLAANIYFITQISTKNNFIFLKKDHPIQRALDIVTDGFLNPLNDNAFVYTWGLNKKPSYSYKNWAKVDDYGYHKSFNSTEVNLDLITNSKVQNHIVETWKLLIENCTDLIDSFQTEYFGSNPWDMWSMITNTDFGPFDFIFRFLNFTEPPTNVTNITLSQYHSYLFVWQLLLSLKTMEETDNYAPGTLASNTIGFSYFDYSLQFIAMKANMFLTKNNKKGELKAQYNRAKQIEKLIQDKARSSGIPEFRGWVTSAAWLPLAMEENIKTNVVLVFFVSLLIALISPIFLVSYKMSLIILIGSFSSMVFTLGSLKMFLNWELGLNEGLMISVSNGFFTVFLEVTVFEAFSLANKKLPRFGKIQAALINSSLPMTIALVMIIVCIPILLFTPFQLFPPFVIYLFFAGFFCILWGMTISPIILSFIL